MYRKCSFIRKVVHYVLILSLLLTTIAPGFSPMQVLAEDEPVSTGTESVFYVDGVNGKDNDETYDGSSAAKAFKTLTKAYNNVPQDNTETTIVICGNVKPYEEAIELKADHYRFKEHTGKVIITSVYEGVDYRVNDTAKIDFGGKYYYFLGDTTFENVSISNKAFRIFANYFPLHLGKGITVKDIFADSIYMGTSTDINGTEGNKTSVSVADTSFTMESGATGMVLGGGNSWQGAAAIGKDCKVTITINGGTVSTLYGSGAGNTDCAHHKSVEITVNADGTVTNLYGAHDSATIYDDVSININGGVVDTLCGALVYNGTVKDGYPPHIKGNVIVTLTGGTITNLNAKQDGADVRGKLVFQYPDNAQDVTLPTAMGFNTLKLTDASTLKAAIDAADATIKNNPNAKVEIDLLADVTSSDNITIGSGVTLDLNGKTLTASSLATFKGNVVDNSNEKSGRLIVGKNDDGTPKCSFSTTNSQMPVYDTEKGGYAFADITKQEDHDIVSKDDSTVFNLFFKPSFDEKINDLLASGSTTAHVNVIIRLTYKEDTHDLTYNNEMVKAVYSSDNMAFYINASGVEKFEGLTITPMVISHDLGVAWSGTSFSDFTINN